MKSYQQLFAELKRRHVFRVAAVYGVAGSGLLQLADVLQDGLRLPDSFLPFVTALVLLGFPLAVILAWAFELTPRGIQRTATAAPGEIERIVSLPASKRWPSGLFALVGLLALFGGTWWVGIRMGSERAAAPAASSRPDSLQLAFADLADDGRPSIAVLPFLDLSPAGDQAYFSDGMTEEILNALVKIRDLKVAARTSAFAFRDKDLDMRAIGDSLGVAYLIEGSVRKAGDQLRITAQLIDANDGTHLWSESYDRRLTDVFAIQTEIAEAIADKLRVPLGLAAAETLVTPTEDLEAYDLYLAGREKIRQRGKGLRDAVDLFEAAIARDSTWAPAWAALAEAQELRSWYPVAWEETYTDLDSYNTILLRHQVAAERAAEKALALDPGIASARVALGSVYRNRRQWGEAEREYRQALAADPDNAEAHQQYSDLLADMGRIDDAVIVGERALRLDAAPIRLGNQASNLWADDRLEDAERLYRQGVVADRANDVPWLRDLRYVLEMSRGRYAQAVALGLPGDLAAVTPGAHERLVRALQTGDLSSYPAELGDSPAIALMTWEAFGDRDWALDALEKTFAWNEFDSLGWLWVPPLDSLRDEPRFQAVLARANLRGATIHRTPRDPAVAP